MGEGAGGEEGRTGRNSPEDVAKARAHTSAGIGSQKNEKKARARTPAGMGILANWSLNGRDTLRTTVRVISRFSAAVTSQKRRNKTRSTTR